MPFVQGRNSYGDRDGRKFGIAVHCTDNTAPARNEAQYATRRTDGVSGHFYVDDREVIQSLSLTARAGHAGSSTGNENAVAVEITGRVSASRQWWLDNVAWERLAQVLAVVCRHYDIAPRRASVAEMKSNPKVKAFYGHDDMRRAWGGTTHTDPGPNFPWDHLFGKVNQAMAGKTTEDDDMPSVEEFWAAQFGPRDNRKTAGMLLAEARNGAVLAEERTARMEVRVAAMEGIVEALLKAVTIGGGNVDVTAIMAGVDQRVTKAVEQIVAETRDAVADLGEGGAAQVRADQ